MIKYIYAFGSICRGEVDKYSDLDIIVVGNDINIENIPTGISLYKEDTIIELWDEGNPFAWHLFCESRMLYSFSNVDFIKTLGRPNTYSTFRLDSVRLYELFKDAKASLEISRDAIVFDYSIIFLVIRNIASLFDLHFNNNYNFSRDSVLNLKNNSLNLDISSYNTLRKCRILSTRGIGEISEEEILNLTLDKITNIEEWITKLISITLTNESI